MRKRILLVTFAAFALLWMGRILPASAATFSCQGQDIFWDDFFVGSSSVMWTVAPLGGSKTTFSSGSMIANYPDYGFCLFTLNTSASSFTATNGTSSQTLVWVSPPSGCDFTFADNVFFIASSNKSGVMADDNLGGDAEESPGSGAGSETCIQTAP